MRLKTSRPAAEKRLLQIINEGYTCLRAVEADYERKAGMGEYNAVRDIPLYQRQFEQWTMRVWDVLDGIFPTDQEWNYVSTEETRLRVFYPKIDQRWADFRDGIKPWISRLRTILDNDLNRYTDLPIKERLVVEDIDSFMKVRDVNPGMVAAFLKGGYLDVAEDPVQLALEAILDVPFHKKDWGGEGNDLYTANVIVNGRRRPTAFLLKGNGLKNKKKHMEVGDCGKNGDQVIRLFRSPADLFVIQYVGNISEAVIQQAQAEIAQVKGQGKDAHFLIMDGQDTARLLYAYGKLPATGAVTGRTPSP
jgi:hypothetical protein